MPVRVCFVCLGNICRSPTAEGVFRHLVQRAGLGTSIEIDSAGMGSWHAGEPPDPRSVEVAADRGIELDSAARTFQVEDFAHFDYLIAMDRENQIDLYAMAPDTHARERIVLLRDFDPSAEPGAEVSDPYYGGEDGFYTVLDICEAACAGLLDHVRSHHALEP